LALVAPQLAGRNQNRVLVGETVATILFVAHRATIRKADVTSGSIAGEQNVIG
jgi:hypothetical protein